MPEINSQINSQSSPDEGKQTKQQVSGLNELSATKIERLSYSSEHEENDSGSENAKMGIGQLMFDQKELASSISCQATGMGTLSTKSGTEEEKALSLNMLIQRGKLVA